MQRTSFLVELMCFIFLLKNSKYMHKPTVLSVIVKIVF